MKIYSTIKVFVKKRKYLTAIIAVILIIAGYFIFSSGGKTQIKFVLAQKGEVVSEISVTGKVKPVQSLDLAFEKSGRISKIYVKVGDKVYEGQTLIGFDGSDVYAQYLQAQASAKAAQAKLNELKRGARPEDIKITQSALDKAKQDLANYYDGVPDVLSDAYSKSDDAVRLQADQLFLNDEQVNPQLTFSTPDSQLKIDLESQRREMSLNLDSWKAELDNLSRISNAAAMDTAINDSLNYLSAMNAFLGKAMDAVTNSVNLNSSNASAYKASLTVGKTEVNTALSSVNSKRQSILSQKIVVQQNQNELDLQAAGSAKEEIAIQEAEVEQANANAAYYGSLAAKSSLRAPFNGTITKINYDPGDIAVANNPAISIIGFGAYEIEANISESDIAGVKTGDMARVILDAYGSGVIFEAKVIQVDLGATIIDGVATYKTTLQFTKEDSRILTGLTANLDILVGRGEGVIYIPTRDIIIDTKGKKTV
ncbi:MAG: HlyD family efflux transporter periplasmic adaptor subunit, partial [Candidatus Wolfebacteria bacterium]|nr:HlyD family efflux transporter periplasmic adaptor subunit [Candidatus Wolfebacteria bacterium]